MNLSLRQLRVFLGVAEASSFTKTAQRLHLSQAALSAIIRELETQLQCRLLDRTTRSVTLTEAGRMFLPTAMHIVATIENAALELRKIGREELRLLRVGVMPHIAVSLMPAILSRFAELYPLVRVELIDSTPVELLRMVEDGSLDAAFGPFWSKESGIDRLPIFTSQLMLVTAETDCAEWPDFDHVEETWRAMQGVPLVCFSDATPIQRMVEENLGKVAVTTGKRTVVGHLETAIAMAEAGFGVAIVPTISAAACARFRVRLHQVRPVIELPFYSITRAGRGNIDTLVQFSQVFQEIAQQFIGEATQRTKKPRKKLLSAAI
jgi:DNA-binding transcriptional LysR family regulator